MLSLTVKKLDAFKFDGVAESDNTAYYDPNSEDVYLIETCISLTGSSCERRFSNDLF